MADDEGTIVHKPQPGRQTAFITCPCSDILFGGARGGGKSFAVLLHFLNKAERHVRVYKLKNFTGFLFRRTYTELEDIISTASEIFHGLGEYHVSKKTYTFKEDGPYKGAILKFRYLEKDKDAEKYQGFSIDWLCIEEAGNFPFIEPINKLRATLRQAKGGKSYFLMTANPGGAGHNWIKSEYIDPSPPMTPFKITKKFRDKEEEFDRIFIPSKLSDNKILMKNDPGYEGRLIEAASGQEWLLKAWLEGDWNIVAGGMFDDVFDASVHVIKPFGVPNTWSVYRAYDWGSSRPFSVGWWARSDGTGIMDGNGEYKVFPPGTLIRIAEWYGCVPGKPNTGLKMLERDIALNIASIEQRMGYYVLPGPADTSIFERHNERCLYDEHKQYRVFWKPANKSPGTRISGWQIMRQLMRESKNKPMESAGLFVFDTCREFIRTVPLLPRDRTKMDDVDTDAEDHIADETRYMVLFKPASLKEVQMLGV